MAKTRKPKKPFLSGYKTYDPDKEGYGRTEQYQETFRQIAGRSAQEEPDTTVNQAEGRKIMFEEE